MMSIRTSARFLEIFSTFVIVPGTILSFIYTWFVGDMPVYHSIADATKRVNLFFEVSFFHTNPAQQAVGLVVSRCVSACIDGFSLLLFVWGCVLFIRVLRCYQQQEYFSAYALLNLKRTSRVAFIWTVYQPIKFTLLSLATTMANPAGERVVAVGVTSHDLIHIAVIGFFLCAVSLMEKAHALQREADLTI